MSRLLHHHDRIFACSDRRHLPGLLDSALPANGWQGPAHRGVLVPKEVDVDVGPQRYDDVMKERGLKAG